MNIEARLDNIPSCFTAREAEAMWPDLGIILDRFRPSICQEGAEAREPEIQQLNRDIELLEEQLSFARELVTALRYEVPLHEKDAKAMTKAELVELVMWLRRNLEDTMFET